MEAFLLLINSAIAIVGYHYLYRSSLLFNDRFGFIVALTGSMIVSLTVTNNLFSLFPEQFTLISLVNVIVGILIGLSFGALVNSQTVIIGIYSGGIGAIIGTMIGAVAKDPSICGLPSQLYGGEQLIVSFGLFGLALHALTMFLLCYAIRV